MDKSVVNDKDNSLTTGLFAFLFPFLGFIVSLFDYKSPHARNLFWFFCAFYGLVHIYMPDETSGLGGADGERYAANFENLAHQDISWDTLSNSFYGGVNGYNDIFEPTVSFVVSRFTDNPHVLFCVFAFIFGFFIRVIYGMCFGLHRINWVLYPVFLFYPWHYLHQYGKSME